MPVTPLTGKFGSPSGVLLVAGYNMLANKLQAIRHKIAPLLERSDGVGDSAEEHTPTGVSMAEIAQEGAYFDTSNGSVHDAVAAEPGGLGPQSAPRVVCLGVEGNAIGQNFFGAQGAYNHEYEILDSVGKLVRANVGYKVTGQVNQGQILHALTQETADLATTQPGSSVDNTLASQRTIPITSSSVANPTTITTPVPHGLATGDIILIAGHSGSTPTINGERTVTVVTTTTFTIPVNVTVGGTGGTFTRGKTNNGGVAYFQWTQLTLGGFTNAVVTVRHSDDNSTYVDLVAMTAITAARGAEIKTVAAGTAVRRYLAAIVDFVGAGSGPSLTYFLGFARN